MWYAAATTTDTERSGAASLDTYINLLASVLISPEGVLWTEDKRLAKLAKRFDIAWSEQ
ncbi:hypothetical protein [Oceanobacter antarcticus]|uniref:PIN domain-containing protein n=1 Tax=Oceanobacter antarcticus TaxID=3133425 RepID=A0ABW8NM10_9GAMM